MPDDNELNPRRFWIASVLIVGGVFALWGLIGLGALCCKKGELVSQFGDHFNVLSAGFSSIAVIGAIYAVILQQKELRLTRDEFKGSRAAQESTAATQERIARIHAITTLLESTTHDLVNLRKVFEEFVNLAKEISEILQYHEEKDEPPTATYEKAISRGEKLGIIGLEMPVSWMSYQAYRSHFSKLNDAFPPKFADISESLARFTTEKEQLEHALRIMLNRPAVSSSEKPHPPASEPAEPSSP